MGNYISGYFNCCRFIWVYRRCKDFQKHRKGIIFYLSAYIYSASDIWQDVVLVDGKVKD